MYFGEQSDKITLYSTRAFRVDTYTLLGIKSGVYIYNLDNNTQFRNFIFIFLITQMTNISRASLFRISYRSWRGIVFQVFIFIITPFLILFEQQLVNTVFFEKK